MSNNRKEDEKECVMRTSEYCSFQYEFRMESTCNKDSEVYSVFNLAENFPEEIENNISRSFENQNGDGRKEDQMDEIRIFQTINSKHQFTQNFQTRFHELHHIMVDQNSSFSPLKILIQ